MDFGALTPARFAGYDQGADFTGPGPVYALADGVVTRVEPGGTGWSGQGAIVVYRLSSGPKRGRYVYVAEDFAPSVRVGQSVRSGDVLGQATGSGQAPGIEVGWAQNPHGSAYGSTSDGKRGGPDPQYGRDFGAFVQTLKPQSGGSGGGVETWAQWARRLLAAAGFPDSANNERFVLGWLAAENPGPDYAWNPLATTLKTPAATRPGGVQAYKDELSGIAATVATIQGGQYPELRRALAGNAPPQITWDALRRSPWDAGHYASQPSPPAPEPSHPVVGAKKGGDGGIVGGITGAIDGGLPGAIWNLPGSIVGAGGDAVSGALGPVGDAISGAADAVVKEAESLFVRGAWIALGLLCAGAAVYMIAREAGMAPSASAGAGGAAAGVAGSTAGVAGEAGSVAELAAV